MMLRILCPKNGRSSILQSSIRHMSREKYRRMPGSKVDEEYEKLREKEYEKSLRINVPRLIPKYFHEDYRKFTARFLDGGVSLHYRAGYIIVYLTVFYLALKVIKFIIHDINLFFSIKANGCNITGEQYELPFMNGTTSALLGIEGHLDGEWQDFQKQDPAKKRELGFETYIDYVRAKNRVYEGTEKNPKVIAVFRSDVKKEESK